MRVSGAEAWIMLTILLPLSLFLRSTQSLAEWNERKH